MNLKLIALLSFFSVAFFACSNADGTSSSQGSEKEEINQHITYDGTTRKFLLDSGVTSVTIDGVEGKNVFLSWVNPKDDDGDPGEKSIDESDISYVKITSPVANPLKKSLLAKAANTTPLVSSASGRKIWNPLISLKNGRMLASASAESHDFEVPTTNKVQLTSTDIEVGVTKRTFKLYNYRYFNEDGCLADNPDANYKDSAWIEMEFVARAVGENVIVWSPVTDIDPITGEAWTHDDEDGQKYTANTTVDLTDEMAEALRDKFEMIYPFETELFGERTKKIFSNVSNKANVTGTDPVNMERYTDLANFTNLLIYDFTAVSGMSSGFVGFFDPKDIFPSYEHFDYVSKWYSTASSNEGSFLYLSDREIFGDYDFTSVDPMTGVQYDAYLTIAHEFAHLLHLSRKIIEEEIFKYSVPFTEIIAQLAEYVLSPVLDIDPEYDIVAVRFFPFMFDYYSVGIMENQGESEMYEMLFAFGVFLLHNYGGAELLNEMAYGEIDGMKAIVDAVNKVSGKSITEEELVANFIEALVCRGSKFAENMNSEMSIKARGKTFTRDGVNVFDMTEHGYCDAEYVEESLVMFLNTILLFDAAESHSAGLRPDYGFHIGLVSAVRDSDTLSFEIMNDGVRDPDEMLYVLISDPASK